jgi:hypothetical protein
MAINYKHFHPVGQYDENTCWAACLEWWIRAQNLGNLVQDDLAADYLLTRGDGGSLNMNGIVQLMEDPRWGMQRYVYYSGAQLTADGMKSLLAAGPAYVAYYSPRLKSNHVNVIYDISGSGSHAKVWAMEPHDREISGDDPGYYGAHKHRHLSAYTTGQVQVGILKSGAYSEGTGYDESYYY